MLAILLAARLLLKHATDALREIESRRAIGKVVDWRLKPVGAGDLPSSTLPTGYVSRTTALEAVSSTRIEGVENDKG